MKDACSLNFMLSFEVERKTQTKQACLGNREIICYVTWLAIIMTAYKHFI
jgi:hypothetical protein